MDSEIRNYLRQAPFDQASIRRIQEMLPDDAELDRWLEETAAEYAAQEFIVLTVAALMAGRRVDAHHLARSAKMLDAGNMLADLAMKFSGDVAGNLLQALEHTTFSFHGMAYALTMAAILYRERGEEIPSSIGSRCRSIAHAPDLEPTTPHEFQNLIPGNYRAYAWTGVQDDAYLNTDFVAGYGNLGVPLQIDAGSSVSLKVLNEQWK